MLNLEFLIDLRSAMQSAINSNMQLQRILERMQNDIDEKYKKYMNDNTNVHFEKVKHYGVRRDV